jgi:transposase InsO family protein
LSASCRQVGGASAARIPARHYAPETNGVVERFDESLRYEHLFRREIDHAATLAEEVEAFLAMFNEVRPHTSLAWRHQVSRILEMGRLTSRRQRDEAHPPAGAIVGEECGVGRGSGAIDRGDRR